MKKYIALLALLTAGLMLFTGCSKRGSNAEISGSATSAPAEISPAEAAAAIVEQVGFEDALLPAEGDVAKGYYMLDDTVADYAVYVSGSGGSAAEVAVLRAASEADAAHAEEIVRDRLESLKESFRNYQPGEMVKLEDAVVEVRGDMVYFVSSDDSAKAKEVIASFYK